MLSNNFASQVSKFHQVNASIEAVKLTMQENIREALANTASLDSIVEQSGEELELCLFFLPTLPRS